MRKQALAVVIALSLAGCAGGPTDDAAGPAPAAPPSSATRLGETVVSVAGTPFLLAFKIPVCAATVALAAPLAGAFALGGEASARAGQRALGEGIATNCGPPYVLSPSPAE
jgi:hypothetical protein